ncbi:hypothetical protein D018_0452A, partial [Vibrio parahaemolyticus VP2007-007]|jgi:hypothetical protein
MHKH